MNKLKSCNCEYFSVIFITTNNLKGEDIHLLKTQEQQFPLNHPWPPPRWNPSSDWLCASAKDYIKWLDKVHLLKRRAHYLKWIPVHKTVPPLGICAHLSYAPNLDDVLYRPSESETEVQNMSHLVRLHSLQLHFPQVCISLYTGKMDSCILSIHKFTKTEQFIFHFTFQKAKSLEVHLCVPCLWCSWWQSQSWS